MLCFLETPVFRFSLLPYYRQNKSLELEESLNYTLLRIFEGRTNKELVNKGHRQHFLNLAKTFGSNNKYKYVWTFLFSEYLRTENLKNKKSRLPEYVFQENLFANVSVSMA